MFEKKEGVLRLTQDFTLFIQELATKIQDEEGSFVVVTAERPHIHIKDTIKNHKSDHIFDSI